MNQDPSLASWSGHMPEDSLISGSSEDLSNLLDFDFDLADLGTPVDQHGNPIATSASQVPTTLVQDAQLTGMEGIQTSQPQQYATSFTDQMQSIEMQGVTCTQAQVNPTHFYLQKQHQHGIVPQGFGQPHQFVPPTPNSTELHGGVARYPPPLDTGAQRRYEPYTRGTDDQGAFTPLISPAMTPLEQQLRFPEYATPGEYLTPLTSPALEAHNHNGNGFMFSQTSGVDMGFVTSPVDARHQLPASTAPSSPAILRRHRRKSSIAQRSNARQVRQSPSMRPMSSRQKSRPGSAIIPGGDMRMWNRDLSQDPSLSDKRNGSRQSSSTESSGQDSVSPEPLSEPLMPPPALPRAFKSPYMAAQESSSEQRAREAATPATLMKLQSRPTEANSSANFSRPGSVVISNVPEETMEDISLPEAASNVDQAATSTSSTITDANELTPRLAAKQTPVLKSLKETNGQGTASVTPSPQIGAMKSPMGPVGLKRADSRPGGRTSKKRQSGSTSQISPALRPKISPSIQPLIRAEGISSETSALYLASKSNYQHILEGTVLPGVSYPENLAENLSSKRTNHKLAEQGRRNRINTALKEIERLLPPSLTHDGNKDKDKDKAAEGRANGTSSKSPDKPASHQPISKASTVELAIVYIKALQQELAETKKQLKDLTTKLDGTENPNIAVEKVNSEKTATQPGKSDPEAPNATQKTTTAEEPNPENDESKAAQ
ncbi:uncharacterized protein CIMG_04726 [Coccidioides immitis RS]|uniref:BHLH domain-containing protein n=3 Tax=Coccidioides immitis TaxID=5501 RepID=J3KE35_COCIM|nr:uncharacterized protein CIMG_04726 [Coccidioides immitis RS]EAS33702.3 hypothetical protein CIMG_04726 [Coccidioides immitis RS]KMP04890.1 phosphorus acquisition-controlling protein [Coccidioides immitis RMSCC 2394]KMU86391.1 phosphorus acquisition-controlling protein [Coccidioides immitis H538.4]